MIVPSLNPDGRERAQEKDCTSKMGQTNARGKDLDTDFTNNASQPETKAIIENLIQKQDFSLSVALMVVLCWSHTHMTSQYRQWKTRRL